MATKKQRLIDRLYPELAASKRPSAAPKKPKAPHKIIVEHGGTPFYCDTPEEAVWVYKLLRNKARAT
jgi:hypothetical protein